MVSFLAGAAMSPFEIRKMASESAPMVICSRKTADTLEPVLPRGVYVTALPKCANRAARLFVVNCVSKLLAATLHPYDGTTTTEKLNPPSESASTMVQ